MPPYEMVQNPSLYVRLNVDVFRLALAASGLSQAQLAKKCDVGRATISEWHAGLREKVSLSALTRVAPELHVPLDFLRGATTDFYPGCGPDDVTPMAGDPLFGLDASAYATDDNWLEHQADRESNGDTHLGWPSAYHLIWASLCEPFLRAYHRDLRDERSKAHEFNRRLLKRFGEAQDAVNRRLVWVLQREMALTWARKSPTGDSSWIPLQQRAPHAVRAATLETINAPPPKCGERVAEIRAELAAEARERIEWARRAADSLWLTVGPWMNGRAALDYSWLEELFWRNLPAPGSRADHKRTRKGLVRAGFYGRSAAWILRFTETAVGARLLAEVRKAAGLLRARAPDRRWAGQ